MKTLNSLAIYAIAMIAAVGCNSQSAPPKPLQNPEVKREKETIPSVVVLKPSFGCLAGPMSKSNGISWENALILAEISKVVYEDAETQVASIKKLGATTVRPIVVGVSYGVVASNDKAVVIGFRGTKDPVDWLTDGKIIGHHIGDGKVHLGFFQVVDAIYKEVFDEAIRQGGKSKTVWITGHSLGGAMAIVFAQRASTESELDPTGIITFGQPLAFSSALAQFLLDKFDTRYIRFVNSWDAVPRLLPNYRHAGSRVYMKNGDFAFRKPMMAVSAPADAPVGSAPQFFFNETEAELEPMTQEEFEAFQKQLKPEDAPHVVGAAAGGPVGSLPIPWIEAHSMLLYIERIKAFGERELNQIGRSFE